MTDWTAFHSRVAQRFEDFAEQLVTALLRRMNIFHGREIDDGHATAAYKTIKTLSAQVRLSASKVVRESPDSLRSIAWHWRGEVESWVARGLQLTYPETAGYSEWLGPGREFADLPIEEVNEWSLTAERLQKDLSLFVSLIEPSPDQVGAEAPDGPGPGNTLGWGGKSYLLTRRQWHLVSLLWNCSSKPVDDVISAIWLDRGPLETPDGTLRALVSKTNSALLEVPGFPSDLAVRSGDVLKILKA